MLNYMRNPHDHTSFSTFSKISSVNNNYWDILIAFCISRIEFNVGSFTAYIVNENLVFRNFAFISMRVTLSLQIPICELFDWKLSIVCRRLLLPSLASLLRSSLVCAKMCFKNNHHTWNRAIPQILQTEWCAKISKNDFNDNFFYIS